MGSTAPSKSEVTWLFLQLHSSPLAISKLSPAFSISFRLPMCQELKRLELFSVLCPSSWNILLLRLHLDYFHSFSGLNLSPHLILWWIKHPCQLLSEFPLPPFSFYLPVSIDWILICTSLFCHRRNSSASLSICHVVDIQLPRVIYQWIFGLAWCRRDFQMDDNEKYIGKDWNLSHGKIPEQTRREEIYSNHIM